MSYDVDKEMRLARLIAVINQKGGVGKTTVAVNLGHALACAGQKVTLVDLDPQGQAAASLGHFRQPLRGVADVLLGRADFAEVVMPSRERLDLVPAGVLLSTIEEQWAHEASHGQWLKQVLEDQGRFADRDWVLFDCPPASGVLSANAVRAVDEALTPVTGDYLGLSGLAHLAVFLKRSQGGRRRPLRHWIVLSRYYPRRKLTLEVEDRLRQHFPGQVLATGIKEAVLLTECPGVGQTILEYKPHSPSAREFLELAQDLSEGRVLR
ncbi:chromosome partitioning protein [Gammaproteobacteria bacterium]